MQTKRELRKFYNKGYKKGTYGGPYPLSDRHDRGAGLPAKMKPFRPFTKEDIILEIGCGQGFLMEGMSEYVKEVHGVDISRVAIRHARKFLKDKKNCRLHVADNIEFFPDEHFDFIWEQTVFQHMLKKHVREYIDQSARKIKTGGYVMFQFVHDGGPPEKEHETLQNISNWEPEEFEDELWKVGFEMVDTQAAKVGGVRVYYMVARKGNSDGQPIC